MAHLCYCPISKDGSEVVLMVLVVVLTGRRDSKEGGHGFVCYDSDSPLCFHACCLHNEEDIFSLTISCRMDLFLIT